MTTASDRDEAISRVLDLSEQIRDGLENLNNDMRAYRAAGLLSPPSIAASTRRKALYRIDDDLDAVLADMRRLLDAAPKMRALL